jgi:hypothetical protein
MSLIEELLDEIIRVAKLQALYYSYESNYFKNQLIEMALEKAKQSIINGYGLLESLATLQQFKE